MTPVRDEASKNSGVFTADFDAVYMMMPRRCEVNSAVNKYSTERTSEVLVEVALMETLFWKAILAKVFFFA
jgi:hypothetical protein